MKTATKLEMHVRKKSILISMLLLIYQLTTLSIADTDRKSIYDQTELRTVEISAAEWCSRTRLFCLDRGPTDWCQQAQVFCEGPENEANTSAGWCAQTRTLCADPNDGEILDANWCARAQLLCEDPAIPVILGPSLVSAGTFEPVIGMSYHCEHVMVENIYPLNLECVDRYTGENIECLEAPQESGHLYGCTGCDGSYHWLDCEGEANRWAIEGCRRSLPYWVDETMEVIEREAESEDAVVRYVSSSVHANPRTDECIQTLEYMICHLDEEKADEILDPPYGCVTDYVTK